MKYTLLIFLLFPLVTLAQYSPLVDLPYVGNGTQEIGPYINALYLLAISVAAFLAVVKIIFGGVKYMLSDVVTDKGDAKKDIKGALLGLLIVLAAVLILETINPSLNDLDVLRNATIKVDGTETGEFSLWDGFRNNGTGESQLTCGSTNTPCGTRSTFLSDDPDLEEKVTAAIVACRNAGNSVTRRDIGGYTAIDCNESNLDPPPPTNPSLDLTDGSLSSTGNYDPSATELGIDCGSIYNSTCLNFCNDNGGARPDRSNPAYCVIANPQNVAAIHCQLDSNHPGCNYDPYGDTSVIYDDPEIIDPTQNSNLIGSYTSCMQQVPYMPGATQCQYITQPGGMAVMMPIDANGDPVGNYADIQIDSPDQLTNTYWCANGSIVSTNSLSGCGDDVIYDQQGSFYIVNSSNSLNFSCNYRETAQVQGCQSFCTTNSGSYDSNSRTCSGAQNPG